MPWPCLERGQADARPLPALLRGRAPHLPVRPGDVNALHGAQQQHTPDNQQAAGAPRMSADTCLCPHVQAHTVRAPHGPRNRPSTATPPTAGTTAPGERQEASARRVCEPRMRTRCAAPASRPSAACSSRVRGCPWARHAPPSRRTGPTLKAKTRSTGRRGGHSDGRSVVGQLAQCMAAPLICATPHARAHVPQPPLPTHARPLGPVAGQPSSRASVLPRPEAGANATTTASASARRLTCVRGCSCPKPGTEPSVALRSSRMAEMG